MLTCCSLFGWTAIGDTSYRPQEVWTTAVLTNISDGDNSTILLTQIPSASNWQFHSLRLQKSIMIRVQKLINTIVIGKIRCNWKKNWNTWLVFSCEHHTFGNNQRNNTRRRNTKGVLYKVSGRTNQQSIRYHWNWKTTTTSWRWRVWWNTSGLTNHGRTEKRNRSAPNTNKEKNAYKGWRRYGDCFERTMPIMWKEVKICLQLLSRQQRWN